jgi:hypothetical protein
LEPIDAVPLASIAPPPIMEFIIQAKIGARPSVQLLDEVVDDIGNLPCGLVEQHLDVVYVLQNKDSCAFAPC